MVSHRHEMLHTDSAFFVAIDNKVIIHWEVNTLYWMGQAIATAVRRSTFPFMSCKSDIEFCFSEPEYPGSSHLKQLIHLTKRQSSEQQV